MIAFLLSIVASLIAGLVLKDVIRVLRDAWNHLLSAPPRIEGDWEATFIEPDGTSKTAQVTLKRLGRSIHGHGFITGSGTDPFTFTGRVERHALIGSFSRRRRRVLAGSGTFVLKILADDDEMRGACIWYDKDADEPWKCTYVWKRISGRP